MVTPTLGMRGLRRGKPRYSIFSLARHALDYHEGWQRAWRAPEPQPEYDAVIIGGGGHGLATAFYLASLHGIRRVAVVEKSWIGGGNTGRNTTIIRSNYLWDESAAIYEHALKLWEGLSQELNFNLMFSQRGVLTLAHSEHEMKEMSRRVNAIRLNGIDSTVMTPAQIKQLVPIIDISPSLRYPVMGGFFQQRGGTARHDAVAWGYARAADECGVDIIQNCEVTGIRQAKGAVTGVETTRGFIKSAKVGCVTAGHSGIMAAMAGLRLPIESRPLQALVSEPIKPIIDTVVMSNAVHMYISQSDKGELVFGAGTDAYNSYAQRGSLPVIEHLLASAVELYPIVSRLRVMRTWGGIVDTCPDASPIISTTPVKGLYFNCGWGTGGFKATPGSGHVFADLIAQDRPNAIAAPYTLERFTTGSLIDEHGAAGVAH
ncbi:MAG: sarcosine oxidase subunit beta family protein [Rhodospirillaceae bacterium]|nr:sarcosine oxidase subunit beta family protein [Rhodospirillaceae bacterium]MBT6140291.1 sarcosine oxidase subunit beta family protein [Rhodospirillaceae bacterium]